MRSVVSVVLRNYNYAHFLEEALESVYIQTYPYIELIIADDASTDCSMAVIDNWLTSRRDRFLRVEVLTTTRNMGQTLNMNRGVRAASGKYVFQLDADNTIQREGIERLVEYSASHPDIEFLFAKLQNHKDSTWYPGCKDAEIYAGKYTEFYYLPVHEQYKKLVIFNFVSGTQPFYVREALQRVGFFDERVPNLEDYPMWLKVTKLGCKLHYFNETVGYLRIHGGSVSNFNANLNHTGALFNVKEHEAIKQILRYYKIDALLKHGHIFLLWELFNRTLYRELVIRAGNKRSFLVNILNGLRFFSPLYIKQCMEKK